VKHTNNTKLLLSRTVDGPELIDRAKMRCYLVTLALISVVAQLATGDDVPAEVETQLEAPPLYNDYLVSDRAAEEEQDENEPTKMYPNEAGHLNQARLTAERR
jgi:hypothetical protein